MVGAGEFLGDWKEGAADTPEDEEANAMEELREEKRARYRVKVDERGYP